MIDPLYCCAAVHYLTFFFLGDSACIRTCDMRKIFASPNPFIALPSQRVLFFQVELSPRTSAAVLAVDV